MDLIATVYISDIMSQIRHVLRLVKKNTAMKDYVSGHSSIEKDLEIRQVLASISANP